MIKSTDNKLIRTLFTVLLVKLFIGFSIQQQTIKPILSNPQIIAGFDWKVYSQAANMSRISPQFSFVSPFNEIFIVETFEHVVKKINSTGQIQLVAGTGEIGFEGDGQLAINAKLNRPQSVYVNSLNEVLIADSGNHRIRKIDPNTGKIETIFYQPTDVLQPIGLTYSSIFGLVLSERSFVKAFKDGKLTTLAGTGTDGFNGDGFGPNCQLNRPAHLSSDENGEILISDMLNNRVRKLYSNMSLITISGGGNSIPNNAIPTNSSLYFPHQAISSKGKIFISDYYSILKIENGKITRILPWKGDNVVYMGISVLNNNVIYCDYSNGFVKQYDTVKGGQPSILAGVSDFNYPIDGIKAYRVAFANILSLNINPNKELIFSDETNTIYKITNGVVSRIGNSNSVYSTMNFVSGVVSSANGEVYFNEGSRIRKFNNEGLIESMVDQSYLWSNGSNSDRSNPLATSLKDASGIFLDSTSGNLLIADTNNDRILKLSNGSISDISMALLKKPSSVAISPLDGEVFFTDESSIKKISNNAITLIAGTSTPGFNGDGTASSVQFNHPSSISIQKTNENQQVIYVSDRGNSLIRRILPNGQVETLFKADSKSFLVDSGAIYSTEGKFIVKRTFLCGESQISYDGITCVCSPGFSLVENKCKAEESIAGNRTVVNASSNIFKIATAFVLFSLFFTMI